MGGLDFSKIVNPYGKFPLQWFFSRQNAHPSKIACDNIFLNVLPIP
jgi:hypothetical protein